MTNLSASYIFSGYSDYWSGHGNRGHGSGCAFAYYGRNTTLRDLVDQWVYDAFDNMHDFEDLPESVTPDDIRACILESFTDAGRADYASGAVCEFSEEWVRENCLDGCASCGERVGDPHCDDCDNATSAVVEDDDCDEDNDLGESPVVIMLIEWTVCEDCDELADPNGSDDSLCAAYNEANYGGCSGDSD